MKTYAEDHRMAPSHVLRIMTVITVFSSNVFSLCALWAWFYFIFARKQVCSFLTIP